MKKLLRYCCIGFFLSLSMQVTIIEGRRLRYCRSCTVYPAHPDPCCARNVGRVNPYYYLYKGYFRTYNWRMTPLNVERLLGPQAFMGPTA